MNDSDLKYIQRVLESNAPDEDRERAAQMVRDIRRSYGQAPAASAEPVAYRVLRKAHDGEWKDDGRDWCNGKPSADLLADIAKRADSWSIECAYAAPVAAQAQHSDDVRVNAVADELFDHQRIVDKMPPMDRDGFREIVGAAIAAYGTQPAASAEPYGWMIDGNNRAWFGEFGEIEARAEARRCGGTCTAFPIFRGAQPAASAEPVYAYRRKGLDNFTTCTRERFEELQDKPHLFETRIFYAAPAAAQAPRPCTCHPDDRPRGPCREKYAASECQAAAADGDALGADPLQAAADWLVEALAKPRPTEIAARLLIGYNRASRLYDAAIQRTTGSEK